VSLCLSHTRQAFTRLLEHGVAGQLIRVWTRAELVVNWISKQATCFAYPTEKRSDPVWSGWILPRNQCSRTVSWWWRNLPTPLLHV